jgi:hypothetical protein
MLDLNISIILFLALIGVNQEGRTEVPLEPLAVPIIADFEIGVFKPLEYCTDFTGKSQPRPQGEGNFPKQVKVLH